MKHWLRDALDACQILRSLVEGLEFDEYATNVTVKGAVQWYLTTLGEALSQARALDDDLVELLPELPKVVGMRNRLVHGYWTISDKTVWDAVSENVPGLQARLAALLDDA
ncbi:MAG: DUF86 domain-containing protein [Thermomicrobiales bacterium]